jgi:hypothetical protein
MHIRFLALATAFACGLVVIAPKSFAAATDYRFELIGEARLSGGKDIIQVRLVHVVDGRPVPNAVIFESTADMAPDGMPTIPAPVKALPTKNSIYSFEIDPVMIGPWAIHLAAKVQGEPESVRGTVEAELVK